MINDIDDEEMIIGVFLYVIVVYIISPKNESSKIYIQLPLPNTISSFKQTKQIGKLYFAYLN